jgi:hypothetical protein
MDPRHRKVRRSRPWRQVDPLDLVETIREGSFCDTFAVAPEDTVGRKLCELATNAVKYAFPSETGVRSW